MRDAKEEKDLRKTFLMLIICAFSILYSCCPRPHRIFSSAPRPFVPELHRKLLACENVLGSQSVSTLSILYLESREGEMMR